MKMMYRVVFAMCAGLSATSAALADETQDLTMEGGALIQQLAGSLQAELQMAMQSGGPTQAVEVCNIAAAGITYDVADASDGWLISRSSHRLRNTSNAADPYTAAMIDEFLGRAESGEDMQSLMRAEIVEEDGERVFRMVRAIPTGENCLACHGGTEVSPEVEAILSDRYPDDAARNFSVGDIRGVFTLSKILD